MLLVDMLLKDWLQEQGAISVERAALPEIKQFAFGEGYYRIDMLDGRSFEDADLDRIISVIRDEFRVHNTITVLKQGGNELHPIVLFEAPASRRDPLGQRSKVEMLVRPTVWTAKLPPPDMDVLIEQLQQNITLYNLSGQWTSYAKDNL